MAFSNSVVRDAWKRAGGRCECTRVSHSHTDGRCNKLLSWDNRGRDGWGKWEAHHRWVGGPDTLSNCEILCWDCHKATF